MDMDTEPAIRKAVEMDEGHKRELILQIEETARNNAKEYRGCSQWSLYALQKHLNLMDVHAFRAASALAGGVAGSGEVCGALLGALMGVGLAYGRDQMESIETSAAFGEAMKRGARVCDRFRNEFGSLRCRDIQQLLFGRSWDLRNPEERNDFLSRDDTDKCSDLVIRRAAGMAAEVILEP
jgi:C_GCAxxG_C_C family probable redox protein